jgi:hypothetical protein
MKSSEIKELLITSLNPDADPGEISGRLEQEGVNFDFSKTFSDTLLNRLFSAGVVINRELDFHRDMNFVFRRIAISGIAAIIVLLISVFLMEGPLSLDSFLGLRDSYDESIICLLTGN